MSEKSKYSLNEMFQRVENSDKKVPDKVESNQRPNQPVSGSIEPDETKKASQPVINNDNHQEGILDQLMDMDESTPQLRDDLSRSSVGKLPTALWDASKDAWATRLGYTTLSDIRSLTNNSLVIGMLIRSLDVSEEQKKTLVSAFPRNSSIHDIVNYTEVSTVDEMTNSLKQLEQSVNDMRYEADADRKWLHRSLGAIRRVIGWLFLERIGVRVVNVSPTTSIKDASRELYSDTSIAVNNELDKIGEDEVQREKTKRNSDI